MQFFVTLPDGEIICSNCASATSDIKCPVCGNIFACPPGGPVKCSDLHCNSRLHTWFSRFAAVLSLPSIEHDELMRLVANHTVTMFSDVLLIEPYASLKIKASISKFLTAITPVAICNNVAIFHQVAAICRGSSDTLLYFLRNPDRLLTELSGVSGAESFVNWLSDPYILCTITTLVESDQLMLASDGPLFEGAPIFRGRHISVTGKFKRGSIDDIVTILTSYSAEVTVGITSNADCLIIGDLNENNDGRSIREANERGISIYSEDVFFSMFDLDSDLSAQFSFKSC